MNVIKENIGAIRFIAMFVGLYVLLNTLYGFWIESFAPFVDPWTKLVTSNVAWVLSIFYQGVSVGMPASGHIPLLLSDETVIRVFEGCNSLNVMIVYLSFLAAYRSTWKTITTFMVCGLGLIYIMNIVRVFLLFEVALEFPSYLYFFHKYLFTAIIYAVVFVLWFLYVRRSRLNEKRTPAS